MKNVALTVLVVILSFTLHAQGVPSGGGSVAKSDSSSQKPAKFVPAPYINYSRAVGAGIGFIPMYMWNVSKTDTVSPQSLVGLLGMYTTNKTYFAMAFGRFYFNEDKWRLSGGTGIGDINYQVFIDMPGLGYVDYNTGMIFGQGQLQRKVFGRLYAGVLLQYMNFTTLFENTNGNQIENEFVGVGALFDWDARSNVYYPYGGYLANVTWYGYPDWLGNTENSNKIDVAFNYFIKKGKRNVWASRVYGSFGIGDISFNQQVVVGRVDLRGYTQGKYRGNGMADIQTEYRYNFKNKMGLVAYGGIGTIYGAINEEDNGAFLYSIGTGFRYNVFPTNHMNIGLDAALGKDDWGIYFRIGEAF